MEKFWFEVIVFGFLLSIFIVPPIIVIWHIFIAFTKKNRFSLKEERIKTCREAQREKEISLYVPDAARKWLQNDLSFLRGKIGGSGYNTLFGGPEEAGLTSTETQALLQNPMEAEIVYRCWEKSFPERLQVKSQAYRLQRVEADRVQKEIALRLALQFQQKY